MIEANCGHNKPISLISVNRIQKFIVGFHDFLFETAKMVSNIVEKVEIVTLYFERNDCIKAAI